MTRRSMPGARLLAAAVLALLPWSTGVAEPARLDTVTVLHTNDLHGHISGEADQYGGVARIAAHVRQVRESRERVLFLDAGDCIAGTPVSTLFRGQPIFEVMSAMGYDAAVLGNHEFDYGWERVAAFRQAATFLLLAANARSPAGELIADAGYLLLDLGSVRVGIIGAVSEHTPRMISRRGNEGLNIEPVLPLLAGLVPEVRGQCDLLILLSHLGSRTDQAVAEAVPGIDLIVGGHDHRLLEAPMRVGGTAIVQALHSAACVGEVMVVVDRVGGRVRSIEGRVIRLRDLPGPDPEVLRAVDKWESQVSKLVDVTIGVAEEAWDADRASRFVERAMREHAGADFGFYNEGGVRAGIPEGQVLARQVWMMLPFGNTLDTVTIRGRDIGGHLAQALREEGVALDPDRVYGVATNSFVGERPALFLGRPTAITHSATLIRDIVIDHIRRRGLR